MIKVSEALAAQLKDAGYSLTAPRRLVFETLQQKAPLTMQELYSRLKSQVNRTSVYRTFALFEQLGIAQRVAQGWKYKIELTDRFVPHHHHFTCLKCQRVTSFDEPELLDNMLSAVARHDGFQISSHTLEIEGLCASCREKV